MQSRLCGQSCPAEPATMSHVSPLSIDPEIRVHTAVVTPMQPSADRPGWRVYQAGEVSILLTETSLYRFAKRALDIAAALLGLIVFSPVIALTAAIIAVDSRGPVIFRQPRVAQGGGVFDFYKFRTMWVDARERFPELYAYQYDKEAGQDFFFKLAVDPRLTRVGRWLRRTSLDELPNLINVLKGDLSLVGPRPEIPDMLPQYRPDQLLKFSVKPGVTGLAQVKGRNILKFQETITADLTYVIRRSFFFDLGILLRTVWVVLMRIGAL